jgi:hypothetical protein
MPAITFSEAIRILELNKPLSREQVRKAYRSKARQLHPDKFPDEAEKAYANEKFIQLKEAYELLKTLEDHELNDPIYMRNQKRRQREAALRKQQILPDWPLLYELENFLQLTLGLKSLNIITLPVFFKRYANRFVSLFSTLRAIINEGPENAQLYIINKVFRLLLFILLFTAYTLIISLVIVASVLIFFIPSLVFYCFYYPIQRHCRQNLKKHTGTTKPNESVFINFYAPSKTYIRLRAMLWPLALSPVLMLFLTGLQWWSISAVIFYLILWIFIALSILQEWKTFNQINAYRKS